MMELGIFSVLALAAAGPMLAIAAFVMTVKWAITAKRGNDYSGNGYLGGLNWGEFIFNWHPVLMVGSLGTCFTIAIMMFRVTSLERQHRKLLHWMFMTAAMAAAIIGIYVVFHENQEEHDDGMYYSNLASMHSWIGLGAAIAFAQNLLLAAVFFLLPSLPKSLEEWKPLYHKWHIAFGIATFILATAANLTGLMEMNTFNNCEYEVRQPDNNPASNYDEISEGCRLSNGIGICLLVSTLLTLLAMGYMRKPIVEMEKSIEQLGEALDVEREEGDLQTPLITAEHSIIRDEERRSNVR